MFEFLKNIDPYSEKNGPIKRLNQRRRLILDPFIPQIRDAKILDLGCHDGRWSYALASVGAKRVIGVEAREELIERFKLFPEDEAKAKVELVCADIFDDLERRAKALQKIDVVTLYGVFYHVMDHKRLLSLISLLRPSLVIIDSEFINVDNAIIQVLQEETSNELNAISRVRGKKVTSVGVPSFRATEFIADSIGFDVTWVNASLLLGINREGMNDYFREGRKIRGTCYLTPQKGL